MKFKYLMAAIAACAFVPDADAALIISGVFDGPLTGGTPKGIELYATTDTDLSQYSVSTFVNGATTGTSVVALTGNLTAGSYLYVVNGSASTNFDTFFGAGKTVFLSSSVVNINGDDGIGLLLNSVLVDRFGASGVDGTGTDWEYLDSWAYRKSNTGPNTTFSSSDWTYGGVDVYDPAATNSAATSPMPVGTFVAVPEPASAFLGAVGILGILRRRR